ncbi:MAG: hypothetical protein KBB11_12465 [Bacteroidales bacterium]|nr:hypothetical protein [Bacteroidales bacterium]
MKTKKIIYFGLLAFSVAALVSSILINPDRFAIIILLTIISGIVSATGLINVYAPTKKSFKISRLIFFSALAILITLIIISIFYENSLTTSIVIVSALLLIFSALSMIVYKQKTDLFVLISIIICLSGFIFKTYHFPGASILMITGFGIGAILNMQMIHYKITSYESHINVKLNFFKNFICITLFISYFATMFRFQHFPFGSLLEIVSLVAIIITILSFAFLLPGSNFIEWTKQHKLLFYRGLLIPVIFFASLLSLSYVFPETFSQLFSQNSNKDEFFMTPYEIPE